MDIGLLKAFIEVYRSRHFGHAARSLYISPSAVSARIKQLEDELGTRLFTRDRNNIELTNAGQKFLLYANNILNTWNRAQQDIAIPEGVDTFLSVATLPSVWDMFLQNWLIWAHTNNPAIALQTDVMQSELMTRHLLDGVLDLGFVLDPPKTPQLLVKELMPVALIMVSSVPAMSAQQAVAENYILVDWGTSFGMFHARQFPDMPAARLRASEGRIALALLQGCGGAAYLPETLVSSQLDVSLFQVKDAPVIHKDAYAVYSRSSSKLLTIEKVLRWFD
ncbi:MAG: LysR family transcriptional regulator [Gammaproteobacteria bacterium]|nr:LysR family transcriptional regulator [Gammaproteobacteria bacterium]